ncbi:MAG: hypothetical protein WBG41_11370 [Acidimicrobiales bacterium]
MKFGNRIGIAAAGATAMAGIVFGGVAGAAVVSPALAPLASPRTVAGSYMLDLTVTGGGGGTEPLVLNSNGTVQFEGTCSGLWTLSGKKFALEVNPDTCGGDVWLFDGKVTSKGLGTANKPGTFIATFKTGQGSQTNTGTWYATRS